MKTLYKVTRNATRVLLYDINFRIDGFDIKFSDGTSIKFGELNDIIERNGEYLIYTNDNAILKYAHRTLEAYYKSKETPKSYN